MDEGGGPARASMGAQLQDEKDVSESLRRTLPGRVSDAGLEGRPAQVALTCCTVLSYIAWPRPDRVSTWWSRSAFPAAP